MCPCDKISETIVHYFLHCDFYSIYRTATPKWYLCPKPEYFGRKSFKSTTYGTEEFFLKINSENL